MIADSAGLTEAELAARSDVSAERLKRLVELGIVQRSEDGRFRPIDIQRIRVAEAFVESGLAVEDLGRLVAEGHITFPNLEAVFGEPIPISDTTFAEFAAEFDLDADLLRRVYTQLNLPQPGDADRLRADDLEFLREFLLTFDARDLGLGDDFLLRAARLCGDGIRRLVESVNSLMREELLPAMIRSSTGRGPLRMRGGGPFVATNRMAGWLIRRHLEAVIHRNIVESIEGVMEDTGIGRRRDLRVPAIAFLDLSGFTRLTGAKGDEEAAKLAVRLSDLVQESAGSGRTVKTLGDGVMLHFREPDDAVTAALDLVDAIPTAGLPPARVGITSGPVVFRDGDYFGRAVNTAARITDYARPGEVLVSEAVADLGAPAGTAFEDLGAVELKGMSEPVRLFRAARMT